LVLRSSLYNTHVNSYSKLKKRNFALQKQKKFKGSLPADEENEYQTNLTLMKGLKRHILRVSIG
jgi:hypothetical protein